VGSVADADGVRSIALFNGFLSPYLFGVSKKSAKIAALIESCQGQVLDAHYLGYFECFNRRLFYEAHDVLEELWLGQKHASNGDFYKGLIQLAGAFVHLQKHTEERPRLRPSAALFRLAERNLKKYPARHERLNVTEVLGLMEQWLLALESADFRVNPLTDRTAPALHLMMVP
jgi:predicted metal-dependent hydrolase